MKLHSEKGAVSAKPLNTLVLRIYTEYIPIKRARNA